MLSFIHIVDTDLECLEKLKNLLSRIFKFCLLREPDSEKPNFTITPTRKLSPTSSAAIIVVSRSQFDLIRERVMKVYSNEFKVRSVGASSVFLSDLRPRIQRLVKDVVYVKAPRNMQMLHVFKRTLFTELKVLLACGRRHISMVVEKGDTFRPHLLLSFFFSYLYTVCFYLSIYLSIYLGFYKFIFILNSCLS